MKLHLPTKIVFVILAILVIAGGIFIATEYPKLKQGSAPFTGQTINTTPMQITSSVFLDGQNIPSKYSCDGDGVNPPLEFKDIPPTAQTLALIVDDPDAPNGTWTHWTIWNIATSTTEIAENSAPQEAVQGQASSGQNVYSGPCPPSGTHHYFFKLYALDSKLPIPSYSTVDKLVEAMQGHVVAQAQLVGLYTKK